VIFLGLSAIPPVDNLCVSLSGMDDRRLAPRALPFGLALLVVVVAGLVIAASGSGREDPPIRAPGLGTAVAVVGVLVVSVGLFVLISLARTLERGDLRKRADTTVRDLVVLVLLVALLIVLFRVLPLDTDPSESPSPPPPSVEDGPGLPEETGRDWLTLGLVAVVTAVLALALLRRRPLGDGFDGFDDIDDALARDVADVLDDAIDRLRREPDARRAVIAAYAAMEDVFARHRLPRRPSEAPLEYLARVLEHVTSTGPASRLTDLFERAMFSTEPFDRRRQDDAVDALVAVRDDVRAAAARSRV
jgi:hypothetical protein